MAQAQVILEAQDLLLELGDTDFLSGIYGQIVADFAAATGAFVVLSVIEQDEGVSTYSVSNAETAARCLELLSVVCFPNEMERETIETLANWDEAWWTRPATASVAGAITGQDNIESVSQAMFLTIMPMGVTGGDLTQMAGLYRGLDPGQNIAWANPTHWTVDVANRTQFRVYPVPQHHGARGGMPTFMGTAGIFWMLSVVPTDDFVTIIRQVPDDADIPEWMDGVLAYRLAAREARRMGETRDPGLADALDQLVQVLETAIVADLAGDAR